jgi:hypothetical protein
MSTSALAGLNQGKIMLILGEIVEFWCQLSISFGIEENHGKH